MNPFIRVIDALNRHDVRYVIVGGFAGYLHGTRRITVDLDLVVDLRPAEALKAIDSLMAVGFQSRLPVDPRLFSEVQTRESWIREKQMIVFSMLHPQHHGFVVDLFVHEPIAFESLFANASTMEFEGHKARICSIDDLISMKIKAGRPKDQADIVSLRELKFIAESKNKETDQ